MIDESGESMKNLGARLWTLSMCLSLGLSVVNVAIAAEGPGEGPPPQGAGGPGGGPPPGKEPPVTAPPADLNPAKLLADGQRALAAGKYDEIATKYADPIINYYAYRYGTRGRRMFVAHDATEAAIYVATGARALDLSTDEGVLNGATLPPAEKGSRNIVVPEGTLPDAFALKAKALAKLGKADEALQLLGRSTVLSPDYPTYWNDIAEVYVQAKRCEDATKAYVQAEETVQQQSNAKLKQEQAARTANGKSALSKCQS
jgi:tetratricopeptide (TPR) repeat protein